MIIKLVNCEDMTKMININYNLDEIKSLLHVTSYFIVTMQKLNLVVQMEITGNNYQQIIDNIATFGTDNEPPISHSHIICRCITELE